MLTWKKIIGVLAISFLSIWIAREITFWFFVGEMKKTYEKFNTQFEKDQQIIHNNIVNAEDKQKSIKEKQEKFEKKFDEDVQNHLNKAFSFQEDTAKKMEELEEKLKRDFVELPKQWKIRDEELINERLKQFDEDSRQDEAKRHKEFIEEDNWRIAHTHVFDNAPIAFREHK